MEQPTTTTTTTTTATATTNTTTTTYFWGIGRFAYDANADRCDSKCREPRWIMGYVRQFCSDFADDYCHYGDFVGAGGGSAAAGTAGVTPKPKFYEPNCKSRNAIHAIVAVAASSTNAYR